MNRSESVKNKPESCLITEKQVIVPGYCCLTFRAPAIAGEAYPGQFVMAYMPSEHGHLLPRPFSIFSADREKGEVSILFEVRGRGTALLAGMRQGAPVKLLGPLGAGFPVLQPDSLLVAGGVGLAPLAFLAASTEQRRTLVYGARTAGQLVCSPAELGLPNLTVVEVTEDGSRGKRGTVTDILPGLLPGSRALFACGPQRMLAAVKGQALQAGVPAWISVEERMACGIGACVGCAVQTSGGYRRVCRDGPVFPAGEVLFND